eukprot:364964-Chlamydomonas_euryale.AAC.1
MRGAAVAFCSALDVGPRKGRVRQLLPVPLPVVISLNLLSGNQPPLSLCVRVLVLPPVPTSLQHHLPLRVPRRYLYQDGTIALDIKLTGELSTNMLSTGEDKPDFGILVVSGCVLGARPGISLPPSPRNGAFRTRRGLFSRSFFPVCPFPSYIFPWKVAGLPRQLAPFPVPPQPSSTVPLDTLPSVPGMNTQRRGH